jgi:mannose-6-phosphate isomerase-like protein (cupin superfamily)
MNDVSREPALLQLRGQPGQTVLARTQRFTIERVADDGSGRFAFAARTEIMLLLPAVGARISGDRDADLGGHSIAILPAGRYAVQLASTGEAYILSTDRIDDRGHQAINAETYADPDMRVRPVGAPFVRVEVTAEIRSHPISNITIPADNGRLRFLQSETMSVNWVEYDGVRDRDALTPHSHADIEQATLAIEGEFVHHLRTPWGRNADLWREDAHVSAGPGSVVIIPPEIIHTTEGVGGGRHVLVDIFAPPRRDFIARNWMFNAGEYVAPTEAAK